MENSKENRWIPKKIFGIRVSAFFETLVFLSMVVAVDHYFGDRSRFIDVNPHPFWIIILLIASLYGTTDALVATALATLFLYVDNVPRQTFNESIFDYQLRLTLLPFTWFAASFILGEIRYRQDETIKGLKSGFQSANEKNKVITKHYNTLKTIKENIETRLTSQENTTANVYQTFRVLETLNPARLLLALDEVVANVLSPKKFSVYAKGPNGFEAAICHGWEQDDNYQRRFQTDSALYENVGNQQRLVCVVNRNDEKMLDDQGVIAGPLVDKENGDVFGMIKIEEMDFDSLNLSSLEAFKALCECIGMAYAQARKYQNAQKEAIHSTANDLLSQPLLKITLKQWKTLSDEFGVSLSKINLTSKSVQMKILTPELMRAFVTTLREILPESAMIFHGKRGDMSVDILLPMVKIEDAEKITHHVLEGLTANDALLGWQFTQKVEQIETVAEKKRSPV